MKMISFQDSNGREISVPSHRVVAVEHSNGRVHDEGRLLLDSGASYGFLNTSTARDVEKQLQKEPERIVILESALRDAVAALGGMESLNVPQSVVDALRGAR